MNFVINSNGVEIDIDVARNLMNDEIVETMLNELWFDNDQQFFDEYVKRHKKYYCEEFELEKANPQC